MWDDVGYPVFIFPMALLFRLEKWRQRSPNCTKNYLNKKRSCNTPWSFCSWASTRKKSSLISVSEWSGAAAMSDHFLPLGTKKPALDHPLWSPNCHHTSYGWVSFHISFFLTLTDKCIHPADLWRAHCARDRHLTERQHVAWALIGTCAESLKWEGAGATMPWELSVQGGVGIGQMEMEPCRQRQGGKKEGFVCEKPPACHVAALRAVCGQWDRRGHGDRGCVAKGLRW